MALPKSTLAWVCNGSKDFNRPIPELLQIKEVPLPKLKLGYALVQVDAAPINPSDVMFIRNQYGVIPKEGDIPGFEGCGTVLAANAGPYGWWLKGKRVSFGGQDGQGSWTQFAVVPIFSCIPVSSKLPVEAAGTLIVNPMTAMGLIKKARKHRVKAMVMNAASSSLGKLIVPLARRHGIQVVGIVRREEAAEPLRRLGAEHVLVSSTDDFLEKFRELANRISATVLLDAVAGEQTGRLLGAMPDRSLAIVYGQMSQQCENGCISFDPDDLVFRQSRIDGYWLTTELHAINGVFTPLLRARTISKLYQRGTIEMGSVHAIPFEDLARFAEEGLRDHKVIYVRGTGADVSGGTKCCELEAKV